MTLTTDVPTLILKGATHPEKNVIYFRQHSAANPTNSSRAVMRTGHEKCGLNRPYRIEARSQRIFSFGLS